LEGEGTALKTSQPQGRKGKDPLALIKEAKVPQEAQVQNHRILKVGKDH